MKRYIRANDFDAVFSRDSLGREMAGETVQDAEILMVLAHDPDWDVRAGVASNPATPIDILYELAEDPRDGVRQCVAMNPSTPMELVLQLMEDTSPEVRIAVIRRENVIEEMFVRLAEDPVPLVREWVAYNHRTPKYLLRQLLTDSDTNVRDSAKNTLESYGEF